MASEVEICNYALSKIGGEPISSLSENTKRAKLCNSLFPLVLKDFAASHPWNFSTRRVQLASVVTPPVFDWDKKFALPADCVRVFDVNDNVMGDREYIIEGRYLLTDEATIYIKYATDTFNINDIPPVCVTALAFKLAEALAYPMTNSDSLSGSLADKYNRAMADARVFDAQEGNKDELYRSTWTDVRL